MRRSSATHTHKKKQAYSNRSMKLARCSSRCLETTSFLHFFALFPVFWIRAKMLHICTVQIWQWCASLKMIASLWLIPAHSTIRPFSEIYISKCMYVVVLCFSHRFLASSHSNKLSLAIVPATSLLSHSYNCSLLLSPSRTSARCVFLLFCVHLYMRFLRQPPVRCVFDRKRLAAKRENLAHWHHASRRVFICV